jgi:predicted MPP superfamily phosphohydrolase
MGANQRKWRIPAAISAGIIVYLVLADCILSRVHARGWAQSALGFINSIAAVMEFPGFYVILRARLRDHHVTPTPVWLLILVIDFALWMIVARVAMQLLGRSGAPKGDSEDIPASRADSCCTSRRSFITSTARMATVGVAGVGAYSAFFESRWFEITHRVHPLRGLPAELDGLRVVQLTDIHHGPNLSLSYVREVVAATNELKADLVLLTGDYVFQSPRYITPVVRELAELRGKIGVVGVLGNHDWWQDAPATRREFARAGIPLIDNSRMVVTLDRKLVQSATEGLCIAGVGDFFEDQLRWDAALDGVPASMPRVLLSHNPDAAEDAQLIGGAWRIDLMLCGHTHGGQVRLPLLGTPIVPSMYGQKYAQGLVKGPACDVFISRGVGSTVLPIRFRVRPEVAVIEFRSA